MGNIDTESKKYMEDSTHFADAFNYLIYDGKPVIDPKALSPLDFADSIRAGLPDQPDRAVTDTGWKFPKIPYRPGQSASVYQVFER